MVNEFGKVKGLVSLQDYAEAHLSRARNGHKYVCPFCDSGNHSTNSDSAFSLKGDSFKCFACGKSGDIFDLAGAIGNIDPNDQRAKLEAVARWAGIPIEQRTATRPRVGEAKPTATPQAPVKKNDFTEGRDKHRAFILQAQQGIEAPEAVEYLAARGYGLEDAKAAGIGYDKAHKRLVLPVPGCDYYHVDRDVTGKASHKYSKPKADEVGTQPLYNPDALMEPCFAVVEGAFDAIALETLGIPAVAMLSTGHSSLTAALQALPEKPLALLCFDRDEAGESAAKQAAQSFEELHLPYRLVEWPEHLRGKDADEMRRNDPEALRSFLSDVIAEAERERAEEQEKAYKAALGSLRVVSAADVATSLYLLHDVSEPVPTGFESLDAALGGGLPVGLTVLGAISSMGKTTFAVQVADQMAAKGRSVLFVTIEQAARELAAKSLSRLTAQLPGGDGLAASAGEIANRKRRERWPEAKEQRLLAACSEYSDKIAPRVHMLEGVEQPSVSDIGTVARAIAAHDTVPPVVFIDYLQLLKAQRDGDSDKQTTDKNIMALRQLSRELKTPVVVISSLNRSSYSTGICLEAFKESGAIEYGSDLLLGLQPANMGEQLAEADDKKRQGKARTIMTKHKGAAVRDCELVVLKNRAGATPEHGFGFTFDAVHSLWNESDGSANAGCRIL